MARPCRCGPIDYWSMARRKSRNGYIPANRRDGRRAGHMSREFPHAKCPVSDSPTAARAKRGDCAGGALSDSREGSRGEPPLGLSRVLSFPGGAERGFPEFSHSASSRHVEDARKMGGGPPYRVGIRRDICTIRHYPGSRGPRYRTDD